jgi:hypothetical protein
VTPDDLRLAAEVCRQTLEPALDADWGVVAGELTWDCRRTLDHIVDALLFYSVDLAVAGEDRPFPRSGDGTASVSRLLTTVDSASAVLAAVARGVPAGTRGYHPAGMADAEGFLAMGCDETLIHTDDIASGLGVAFAPPADLCARVLARLFPWAPRAGAAAPAPATDPWAVLRWANGRTALPGRARLDGSWYWHCAPLDEWDGTVARRTRPPGWT